MTPQRELELKFQVPARQRHGVLEALKRLRGVARPMSMSAQYWDTPDRRLAAAGLSWRLRRESRQWRQTLKAGGDSLHERIEHEVAAPDRRIDAARHAGTVLGDRLGEILEQAHRSGVEAGVRYQTEIRRLGARVRSRGALIEIVFDEGRIIGPEREVRVCEIEFELLSGSPEALFALAAQWQSRHGLWLDPRTKSQQGDRLAQGLPLAPPRRAVRPVYAATASATAAQGAVLDECLAQVLHNAAALCADAPEDPVTLVHQLRVGMRRLRAALRLFDGWVPPAPPELLEAWRDLFAELGATRDRDVFDSGVARALAAAGAPPLNPRTNAPATQDPRTLMRGAGAQSLLLQWSRWHVLQSGLEATDADDATGLGQRMEKRLRRWHERFSADAARVTSLDETALHELRKRIKRQRYAVEFAAPLLRRRDVQTYLERLAAAQERLGDINDLHVARSHYQSMVTENAAAWFALGWLASRIAEATAAAAEDLLALAGASPPGRRRHR